METGGGSSSQSTFEEVSFTLPGDREILVDDIRVRSIGVSSENIKDNDTLSRELLEDKFAPINADVSATETVSILPSRRFHLVICTP